MNAKIFGVVLIVISGCIRFRRRQLEKQEESVDSILMLELIGRTLACIGIVCSLLGTHSSAWGIIAGVTFVVTSLSLPSAINRKIRPKPTALQGVSAVLFIVSLLIVAADGYLFWRPSGQGAVTPAEIDAAKEKVYKSSVDEYLSGIKSEPDRSVYRAGFPRDFWSVKLAFGMYHYQREHKLSNPALSEDLIQILEARTKLDLKSQAPEKVDETVGNWIKLNQPPD